MIQDRADAAADLQAGLKLSPSLLLLLAPGIHHAVVQIHDGSQFLGSYVSHVLGRDQSGLVFKVRR